MACRGLMQHDCGVAQAEREEVRKAEKARKKEEARLAAEAEAKATAAAEAEAAAKAQADEDAKRKVQSLNRAFESGTPFTAFQCHVARPAMADSAPGQSDWFDTRGLTLAAWPSLCWKQKQLRSLCRGVRPAPCVADRRPAGHPCWRLNRPESGSHLMLRAPPCWRQAGEDARLAAEAQEKIALDDYNGDPAVLAVRELAAAPDGYNPKKVTSKLKQLGFEDHPAKRARLVYLVRIPDDRARQ